MSRLNDLLRQLRMDEPELADDLQREFDALADRRSFGLNFERHVPEAVELPGRKVRKGDKVRALPPRGEKRTAEHDRLWKVVGIATEQNVRTASLRSLDDAEDERTVAVDDLVVVAEFRDPIYPGLVSTGKVERGGDKPFHTVINAENFHALQTLLFTHRGKVDCIYIDPPYNTGAKDWKYNNDYVEDDDHYRHSKWLAFMERRLLLAKDLLNPSGSSLVVAIDEKEYLRLGLLLEQLFPNGRQQMVSLVINPKGTGRADDFARTNEFLYFVRFGEVPLTPREDASVVGEPVAWETTRRRNLASRRGRKGKGACGPNQFYPIFVDRASGAIVGRGDPIPPDLDRMSVGAPPGCDAVFPVRKDGTEMNWEYVPETFDRLWEQGYVRANGPKNEPQFHIIQHIPNKARQEIEAGTAIMVGRREDSSVLAEYRDASTLAVTTQWNETEHSAEHQGTNLLKAMIPGRPFPFPKSLYAVADALRTVVGHRPDAVIVDFFAGSGTTSHAVFLLNMLDGGRRRSISVTNNEVSADEQASLTTAGLRAGDGQWEDLGICEHITKPRLTAAINGRTCEGKPIKGAYKTMEEISMSEGFEENVEFFTLTYEAPLRVASHREYERIAPLLWLRAGSEGRRIDDISDGWDVADVYGVIADLDQTEDFLKAIAANDQLRMAFIVTDEDRLFESIVAELPDHVEPVRLYEAYLRNFEIEAGRGAR